MPQYKISKCRPAHVICQCGDIVKYVCMYVCMYVQVRTHSIENTFYMYVQVLPRYAHTDVHVVLTEVDVFPWTQARFFFSVFFSARRVTRPEPPVGERLLRGACAAALRPCLFDTDF